LSTKEKPFAAVYSDDAGTTWIGVEGYLLLMTANPTKQDMDRLHSVASSLNSAAPEYAVRYATAVLRKHLEGGAS